MIQINENVIVDWSIKIFAAITSGFAAFAWYIWRGDRRRLRLVEERLAHAVFKDDLEVKAKEIEARVAVEHQRIYDKVSEAVDILVANQNRSNDQLRDDLNACNRAVMDQINGPISEQITEIRNYVFNHIERRSTERK